jgi:hypothetical protein
VPHHASDRRRPGNTAAELTWAASDEDDLHVQVFARIVVAEYVVSANTRHFPNPERVEGSPRGQLEGVVWITPGEIRLIP